MLLCVFFYQKLSVLLTQDAPDFCSFASLFSLCVIPVLGKASACQLCRLEFPLWALGRMWGRRQLLPLSLSSALPQNSPGLWQSHLGTRAVLAFVVLLLELGRGTAHTIHQAVPTREQLLVVTRGLGWVALGNRPWTKILCEPFPAPLSHSRPCNSAKEEALLKWGFWQMTGKQSPPHTPDSLTALNWHSFRSWDGPRAADSKTLGIRTQDWKVFVPSWLGASFLGLLCLPMLNVNQQSSCTFAKKPQVSWQIHYQASGKTPRFPLIQRRKGWSRVVSWKPDKDKGLGIDKAVHSCWSYSRHRGVFSRKDF